MGSYNIYNTYFRIILHHIIILTRSDIFARKRSSENINFAVRRESKRKCRMDWNYGEEEKACISAMQHCFGPVLNAAIELKLFEIIAKASPTEVGVTASDVASQLPTQHPELARRIDRILSLLATILFSLVQLAQTKMVKGVILAQSR